MKICASWLREWVNPLLSDQRLAEQLTLAGLEVDAINPVAGEFSHVVVAEVLQATPHPQADKLTLCEIDAGLGETFQVVCGAANVRQSLRVALARLGARLPNGFKIKEVKLRGELSQGMLCSLSELGLEGSSEGIMELADDAPIGMDLREYMQLDDQVFEIDLTPNRADCLSLLGVAREVAALNQLKAPEVIQKPCESTLSDAIKVKVQAPESCPHYCGRIIRGISINTKTPLWMMERLRRSGIRAVHPVVDVTNYVMLELGQPLHCYDLSTISGSIQVRFAHEGESLALLGGQEILLNASTLLIADDEKPLALAGVIGGDDSSVQEDTTDLFLESAFFSPLNIAGVGRRYGISSDASQRFERGVDPEMQIKALERATELLQEIVGGQLGPIVTQRFEQGVPKRKEILFNPEKVAKLTGVVIGFNEIEDYFNRLGMQVLAQDEHWIVNVPTHRFDISEPVDLIEEALRLYGYDRIIAEPMLTTLVAAKSNPYEHISMKISSVLVPRGYHETISYSFVDPDLQAALYPNSSGVSLLNPISQELSQMRAGMWPGLIAAMMHNLHRQQTAMKLFEVGVAFDVGSDGVVERQCLAGLIAGELGDLSWCDETRKFDFYDLKGDLNAIFRILKCPDVQFVADSHDALHPGKSACIMFKGKQLGWMGALHPQLLDELDFNGEVFLFELSIEPLLDLTFTPYKAISKYPHIRRDLSLLVDKDVCVAEIEKIVRCVVDADWLKAFDVFDVYEGESIPEGKKSVAIAMTLQDDNRTLVDEEINAIISAILKMLDEQYAITLRD